MKTLLLSKLNIASAFACILFFVFISPTLAEAVLENPSFEATKDVPIFDEGIDSMGYATLDRSKGFAPNPGGGISPTELGVSVSVADLNGDGLPDIGTMDGNGAMRVLFNIGTKTEPKFGPPELSSFCMYSVPRKTVYNWGAVDSDYADIEIANRLRMTPRLALYNLASKYNMLVTTFPGQMFNVFNSGTAQKADFKPVPDLEKNPIKTGSRAFGQALSPFVVDWNKDGKLDIILGEGSYSANSVFIISGKSATLSSSYEDKDRLLLASGMGLEQLSPCAVDYNGDGYLDLLVTERGGRIAVYLNPGASWKLGDAIPFHTFITKNGAPPEGVPAPDDKKPRDPFDIYNAKNLLMTGGISTISTGDFNGDGLFDIVVGKPNGRIALALNTGTPTEPKFAALMDIKLDVKPTAIASPAQWNVNTGLTAGNYGAFVTVAKKGDIPNIDPVDGTSFLYAGYRKNTNAFMAPSVILPSKTKDTEGLAHTPNTIIIEYAAMPLFQAGKKYNISFSVRGKQVTKAKLYTWMRFVILEGEKTTITGSRGGASTTYGRHEVSDAAIGKGGNFEFPVTPDWKKISVDLNCATDPKLKIPPGTAPGRWAFIFSAVLAPGQGDFALDDIKITEK